MTIPILLNVAMGREIERKFLVHRDAWRRWLAESMGTADRQVVPMTSTVIRQAYLSVDPRRTVRVRIEGRGGTLTIKGETVGATRAEFEYALPLADARQLLGLCLPATLLEKTRHRIRAKEGRGGDLVWEVDEFQGKNRGLILAEIELEDEGQSFDRPEWLGREVTGDPRYYNSQLAQHPYSTWATT